MALQSCYECNKEISTKALMCPQCGAPQNPVSGLVDKAKNGFFGKTFKKVKNHLEMERNRKEIERKIEEDLEKVVQEMVEVPIKYKSYKAYSEERETNPFICMETDSKLQKLQRFPCLLSFMDISKSILSSYSS